MSPHKKSGLATKERDAARKSADPKETEKV